MRFQSFAKEVRNENRYIFSSESNKFIAEFEKYIETRKIQILKDAIYYRSQLGCDYYLWLAEKELGIYKIRN